MPEKTVLICDVDEQKVGEWVAIEIAGRRYAGILCDEHAQPLRELAKRMKVDVQRPPGPGRGTDEDRLRGLIVED